MTGRLTTGDQVYIAFWHDQGGSQTIDTAGSKLRITKLFDSN